MRLTGNERLLRYLQDPGMMSVRYSDDTQASKFAVQAYAGLVLARQQKAPLARCVKSGNAGLRPRRACRFCNWALR